MPRALGFIDFIRGTTIPVVKFEATSSTPTNLSIDDFLYPEKDVFQITAGSFLFLVSFYYTKHFLQNVL